MIALFVAQAIVTAPPPAPPPTPAPVIVSRSPFSPRMTRPRFRVAVTVRAADGVLWNGSLWLSPRAGASWRQTLQEAQPDQCATPASYPFTAQSELNVQLNQAPSPDDVAGEKITLNVRWTRPAANPCDGNRTVELRQTVAFDSREPVIVRGDGGLVVELRRN